MKQSEKLDGLLLGVMRSIDELAEIEIDSCDVTPQEQDGFGDYSSSVVFSLAKKVGVSPHELGTKIVSGLNAKIESGEASFLERVELKNGGFINLFLKDEVLVSETNEALSDPVGFGRSSKLEGKTYVVEYTDPNPFKVFHIGHLMTNTIGESLSRLFEVSGASVNRLNYQGDVGMHVAKSVWGLKKLMQEESIDRAQLSAMSLLDRQRYLGRAYVKGATAYKEDESVKPEMHRVNILCYIAAQEGLIKREGWTPRIDYKQFIDFNENEYDSVKALYDLGREASLEYFETIYQRLGTKFDRYYFESKTGELGLQIVRDNLKKGVFAESEGAIVFHGEDYGLQTRVFVNKLGLPVYEAKDLALAYMKFEDYRFDRSYIVTGNEINEYFDVVLKALEQIYPEISEKTTHVGHGMLNLKEGKMSSRTGNVVGGEELLDKIRESLTQMLSDERGLTSEEREDVLTKVSVGAWKYSVLKQKIGRDIPFDFSTSLSLEGNSGPYLQYTYARCRSVLRNAEGATSGVINPEYAFDAEERKIMQLIERFPFVVSEATRQLAPHTIATYLFDLAQSFNSFYNTHQILDDDLSAQAFRLSLSQAVAIVLKNGLWILGIEVVEKM